MNTSTPIIEARDLTVGYGSYVVQKDLNFTINRQDVFIIMGPSGCGKSTLLRVLVGLLQPTKGQVLYRGQDFWAGTESERQKLLSGVGLLFQSGALWSSMTLAENVALPLQRYTKLSSAEIREQTSLKLALVGLAGFEDYYPSEISGGMRKRAGLARAIVAEPRILLCDEPTSALDPSGRREVLEILKSISKDTTVLFSTHILSDVERICDQIGILDDGRLVLEGALEEVRGSYRTDRLLVVPQETASLAALAQGLGVLPEVQKAEVADGGVILTIGNPETAGREILRYLSACDIPIAKYELLEPNLEQVFLEAIHP